MPCALQSTLAAGPFPCQAAGRARKPNTSITLAATNSQHCSGEQDFEARRPCVHEVADLWQHLACVLHNSTSPSMLSPALPHKCP